MQILWQAERIPKRVPVIEMTEIYYPRNLGGDGTQVAALLILSNATWTDAG